MVEEIDPSGAVKEAALTCPRCGAPLPVPSEDGFVTCEYCRVRTEVSQLVPPQYPPSIPEEVVPPEEPTLESTEGDERRSSVYYVARVVAVIVVIVVILAVFETSQPQMNPGGIIPVAHCSVTINASATSGPAPFTATFTAQVTTPPGDTASVPEWQFGPFPPGFDLNYTYGTTVTHTWNTSGSYGVHVTVPDSSGLGCYYDMSVNVT